MAKTAIHIPSGWHTTFIDPTLHETWALKEDLLQLEHRRLDRLLDLGWYDSRFVVHVFQGNFQGECLARRSAKHQSDAARLVNELLLAFGDQ